MSKVWIPGQSVQVVVMIALKLCCIAKFQIHYYPFDLFAQSFKLHMILKKTFEHLSFLLIQFGNRALQTEK
jgi:hypothetical protein